MEKRSNLHQTKQQCFDFAEAAPAEQSAAQALRTGTFTDNMKLPVHRWFRYSAGFSADWVSRVIRTSGPSSGWFFDPFAGSGTSLLAAQAAGMRSAGAESHPFVCRIASAKLGWSVDTGELRRRADRLAARAGAQAAPHDVTSPLLLKCYTDGALQELEALRRAFAEEPLEDPISVLIWLAITAILRECSGVGTAQWQYVLPNKTKSKVVPPLAAFARRIDMFCDDIAHRQAGCGEPVRAHIRLDDARSLSGFDDLAGKVTLVVTSPPYPNNYDYADATRLEMTFWREVDGWGDLQSVVRNKLIRSCSQHSAAEKLRLEDLLGSGKVDPIRAELSEVCFALAELRKTRLGKKTYDTMVAAYFNDMAETWTALRKLCAPGADICFVIGDSAPYGIHVPADRWLAQLAVAAGFEAPRFEKIRDRNLKWKNRKHRVPLQEGNLWLKG